MVRQCFEYNRDICRCLEVIRPEFSACEKSNTPKGQKNNKRLQSLAVWPSIFTQTDLTASRQPSLCFPKLKGTKQNCFKYFKCGHLSFMLCIACKSNWWQCVCCVSVHTIAGWGLQREGSASVSDAPWGPSPGHWWESWGRNTETAGRHIWRSIPIQDTRSHSAVKMLFFRQILPQFIPTNGSLHTSKSYGCLNGCTAHMYTPADRYTGTHKHKQIHKSLCQGKRDQLPLQAW